MAKKLKPEPRSNVHDEAVHIPIGDTKYTIDLDHQTVEELSQGICSELMARRMFLLLKWQRESLRQWSRERAPDLLKEFEPETPARALAERAS